MGQRITRHVRELLTLADELGWELKYTRKGHLVFLKEGRRPVVAGSTPGDHRAMKNLKTTLARAEANAR
jgi:hypothetical protein